MKPLKFIISFFVLGLGMIFSEPNPCGLLLLGITVNSETLESARRTYKAIFLKGASAAATVYEKLAMVVISTGSAVEHKWLENMPSLREWVGERVIKSLSAEGMIIKNKRFEATVSVSRDDVEDDQLGLYSANMKILGENATKHPDNLVTTLIKKAFTSTGYDGKFFCATDHPNGDLAPWSNKSLGILSSANYSTARAEMMSLVNDEGEPLGVLPDTLIVPPQLEAMAKQILKADQLANGQTNVNKGEAEIMVLPKLSSNPTQWFLAQLANEAKPFIFQDRKKPEFVALDNPTDPNVFKRNEFVYGVDYRGNAGFGFPQLIHGSTGTV